MSQPPFRNPWSDETPAPPFTLSPDKASRDDGWPHRLLHVPTMTSHVNQGDGIYNNFSKPSYNVLSYTWGRWRKDDGEFPSIEIHGVPWTIPCIDPNEAFNPTQFKNAIEQAAHGVQEHQCDWLWVDIACIPQERQPKPTDNDHAQEADTDVKGTTDGQNLKLVGAQEVGRQVVIFASAKKSFVWLWGLSKCDLQDNGSQPRVKDLEDYWVSFAPEVPDLSPPNPRSTSKEVMEIKQRFYDAANRLCGLDKRSESFETWIARMMNHGWCESLWTLQEMVLRPDAWILFDDGLLELHQSQDIVSPDSMRRFMRTPAIPSNNSGKWSLSDIKYEMFLLRLMLDSSNVRFSRTWKAAKKAEKVLKLCLEDPKNKLPSVTAIQKRLRRTLKLMRKRGMDALDISFPHTAYSAAQHRDVSKDRPLDRVYGIVQTYGIACESFPQGATPEDRLAALQDDFGKKLVIKMPVLSQIFIHSLGMDGDQAQCPRRSWLITTKCKVNDHWWEPFESKHNIINLFDSFKPKEEAAGLLEFSGRAWDLDSFVRPRSPSDPRICDRLFKPRQNSLFYNGLMLDNHVSKEVVGRQIDYFRSFEDLSEAVDKLKRHYGKDPGATGTPILRVASLGCSFRDDLPRDVYHVALVLAPSRRPSNCGTMGKGIWSRIGLMRWVEEYQSVAGRVIKKHPDLPEPREFSCLID